MPTVRLPSSCDHHALIAALSSSGLLSTAQPEEVAVHFTRGCFITPAAISLLGAWGLRVRAADTRLRFSGDEDVIRYLSRMDVFRSLGVTFTEFFGRHVDTGRFIPMKLVDDSVACKATVDAICDLVLHQFDDPHHFLPALEWAVNEVVDNILLHSESPVPGVVCAQFFPTHQRLHIGVCDMGKGLKESLSEAFTLRTHAEAIAKAVQRGVTRNPTIGMGNGLAGTVEIAKLNGGTFELWSGDATYRLEDGSDTDLLHHPFVPGTGLSLSLRTTHPVDLSDTFIGSPGWTYIESIAERVTDSGGLRITEECAYTGTRHPATLLRRKILAILPRLERPLILDFHGVDIASSSFLDELLGRLAEELGIETFRRQLVVVNMSSRLRAMSNVVIEQRLSTMSASTRQPPAPPSDEGGQLSQARNTMSALADSNGLIGSVARKLAETEHIIVHYDPPTLPATSGSFEAVDSTALTDDVKRFVASQFADGLFTHQHRALEHILKGVNTVVATRTSSGKSLIYSLPVLDSLCRDRDSTALFLYPQKALANDQLLKLREAVAAIPCTRQLAAQSSRLVSRYDGATEDDDKPEIRASVQLLLTNPDMLHFGLLQWHQKHWQRFFSHLKHVIVDECHEYRGIFGTNVAYILRRLRQVCQFYGSSPTFVATSATVSEPKQHLETLVGVPFTCVGSDEDGSRQGARKFWMTSSNDHFYDFGRKLTTQLADEGLSVLTFCPSRTAAERLMSRTTAGKSGEPDYVRVYRAGLSPRSREEIERGLRDKTIRAVYSTTALELGIDIGAIDVVICIGLPHSMMSLWQRAGRAARAGKEGAIVLIPADTPIDSYYANAPGEFFARDHEPLVLNLGNRRVIHQHYACAVHEVGGDEDRLAFDIFGSPFLTVKQLRSEGKLDDVEIFYQTEPHMEVNIRSMGEGAYALEVDGEKIGDIDSFHLLREAYRNAIYRHGGQAYRVQTILKSERKVKLRRDYSGHETSSYVQKHIRLKRRYSYASYPELTIATVGIDATEFIVNVVEKDRTGATVQNWPGSAGMPQYRLPTDGTLLRIHRPAWESIVGALGHQAAHSALQSCERLLGSLFPTVTGPCDTQDFSSASQVAPGGEAEIYLYDLVYDGADLAISAFERMSDLLEKALERVRDCDCTTDEGCFRCIANPRFQEPTSKQATRRLLDALVGMITSETPTRGQEAVSESERLDTREKASCPTCHTAIATGDRFCRNCGTKVEN